MERNSKTRAEKVRTERRKKPGTLTNGGGRLAVNESALDRDTFQYRWVNDKAGRMAALHEQDWDPVIDEDAAPDGVNSGTPREIHGGAEESGKPYRQVLMKKRKDWYQEDQQEKMAPLKQIDEQLQRGKAGEIAAETDADLARHAYTPGGTNSMEVKTGVRNG